MSSPPSKALNVISRFDIDVNNDKDTIQKVVLTLMSIFNNDKDTIQIIVLTLMSILMKIHLNSSTDIDVNNDEETMEIEELTSMSIIFSCACVACLNCTFFK